MTDQERITALEARIATLEERLATLEQKQNIPWQPTIYRSPVTTPYMPTPWEPWAAYCSTNELAQN